ncbi:hypothetical protein ACTMTI_13445 [Nonomuraea sp. H19]|uniref:RNA polymerase sigma factor n=1 Tax=Nonomuraea sp. H19 TaxID=3452206 RepID=UPI003F8901D2
MSQPLTDQRPRAELVAELYDQHATGLFAYCADQLGDLGSASDVLVSVLSAVPATEPPRAALYALARREIHRRDIVYAPPMVDPLIDPATALVERTLRELRPHQREVLVLCAVCGLSKSELAWVLDVAPDTAEELAVGAGHRFRQALGAALASISVRVPKPVADVYGALTVAPLPDVLGRLPWPQPPGALRIHFAGSRTATPAPLFVKPRWPTPPVWPQPLADADPATSTVIFPAELMTPPSPSRVPVHEATTAPMPKLRDPLDTPDTARPLRDPLGALDAAHPFRPMTGRNPQAAPFAEQDPQTGPFGRRDPQVAPFGEQDPQTGPFGGPDPQAAPFGGRDPQAFTPPGERPFFMAASESADGPQPFVTGDVLLPKDSPEPFATGDVLLPSETPPRPFDGGDVLAPRRDTRPSRRDARPSRQARHPSAADDILVHKGPPRPQPEQQETEEPVYATAAPLFQPRPKPADPASRAKPAEPISRPKPADPISRPKPAEPVSRTEPADPISRPKPADPISRAKPAEPVSRPKPADSISRAKPAEPVYRMPLPWENDPADEKEEAFREEPSFLAPRPVRARPVPKRRPENPAMTEKARRRKDRHFDWAWELIGFLICVAIAMIVFFSVPMFVDQ